MSNRSTEYAVRFAMRTPSGVSRRVQQCIEHLQKNDPEGALVNLFPAIDKTGKKRRPNDGVGSRVRGFLKDEEVLMSAVGMGNVFKGCEFDGLSFEKALYKFGRTPIAHEGELDPLLKFNSSGGIQIGLDGWNLPVSYISGMTLAVIVAPENTGEMTSDGLKITVLGKSFSLNEIWGNPESVRVHMCETFRDPNLFD